MKTLFVPCLTAALCLLSCGKPQGKAGGTPDSQRSTSWELIKVQSYDANTIGATICEREPTDAIPGVPSCAGRCDIILQRNADHTTVLFGSGIELLTRSSLSGVKFTVDADDKAALGSIKAGFEKAKEWHDTAVKNKVANYSKTCADVRLGDGSQIEMIFALRTDELAITRAPSEQTSSSWAVGLLRDGSPLGRISLRTFSGGEEVVTNGNVAGGVEGKDVNSYIHALEKFDQTIAALKASLAKSQKDGADQKAKTDDLFK